MAYTKTFYDDCGSLNKIVKDGTLYQTYYTPGRLGTRTGTRVLGWRKLIEESRNATSDFSTVRYRVDVNEPASGSYSGYWPSSPSTKIVRSFSGTPGNNQTFTTLVSPPENAALSRLYDEIRYTRSEMNGLTFMGELRETLRMIRKPAAALIDGVSRWADDVHHLHKRNPSMLTHRNRRNTARVLSGLWLERVYGWIPFISEVKGLARTAGRIVVDNRKRIDRVSARMTSLAAAPVEVLSATLQGIPDSMPSVSSRTWYRLRETEASCKYIAFLRSSLSGSTTPFERAAQISGLTWENVVPTIYELTPYSFLIDYFSNLGDVLNAQFTDVSDVAFALKSNVTRNSVDVKSYYIPKNVAANFESYGWQTSTNTGSSGRFKETQTIVSRVNVPSLPVPRLEFTLTSSPGHLTNMLALLTQKLNPIRF